jgi:hypothetical protein
MKKLLLLVLLLALLIVVLLDGSTGKYFSTEELAKKYGHNGCVEGQTERFLSLSSGLSF